MIPGQRIVKVDGCMGEQEVIVDDQVEMMNRAEDSLGGPAGHLVDESLFASWVRRELERARLGKRRYSRDSDGKIRETRTGGHKPLNSSHEAYAVILEELDEFWAEVCKRRENRDRVAMLKELIQIGAMAQRAAEDIGLLDDRKPTLGACAACEGSGRFTSPHGASLDCPHCQGTGKPAK